MSNFIELDSLAAQGAKLIRVVMQSPGSILRDLDSPYAIETTVLDRMDQLLDHARSLGIQVFFDAHSLPGCEGGCNRRNNGSMGMWNDDAGTRARFQNMTAEVWGMVANRMKNRGPELFGYDLMNEPCTDGTGPGGVNRTTYYDEFLAKVIPAIRSLDSIHRIIVEPNCAAFDSLMFTWPQGSGLVFSPHYYLPYEFTGQLIGDAVGTQSWPNGVPGFNYSTMVSQIDQIANFSRSRGVPILIGEFGTVKWSNPRGGNQYLKDLIDLFEARGFYWTYFAWNDWYGWRANLDDNCCGVPLCSEVCKATVNNNTQRMQLLRSYWIND